uniref:Uncharacterized protein n=1 Tax=Arundo donax TaxID=35708 RepID=A0A0A9CZR9_ARUDO
MARRRNQSREEGAIPGGAAARTRLKTHPKRPIFRDDAQEAEGEILGQAGRGTRSLGHQDLESGS